MEINQLLVSASRHDAITNAAFELRALLRQVGPSHIYAHHIEPALSQDVLPMRTYQRRLTGTAGADILVFHASIGEPAVFSFLERQPERVVLLYHNISPPEAFRSFDPAFAGLLEAGRDELAALRDRAVLALAVSEYNADELRALGYRNVAVSPLVLDMHHLAELDDDAGLAAAIDAEDGPVLLFVGQLLPHKRPDLLLKAFHVLTTYLVPDARLVLVGASRLAPYGRALRRFATELNLSGVRFAGSVTEAGLATLFRRADALVTASEHEGFCVPLIEAMSFGVPIVARANAAIPETLGGAGLLLPGDAGPEILAEAMAEILTNNDLRGRLIGAGQARLTDLDPTRARETFLRHMLSVA
jgi:glycosyltransferase involved in cell wall biosynthesis